MTFAQFAWRLLTGNHLDGVARTDATWFRAGKTPSHRLTWWTAKPRFHRMMWRWGVIVAPVGFYFAYENAPVIRVNAAIMLVGVYAPFLSWRIAIMIVARIPRVRVVTVMVPHDQVPIQVNAEIDEVVDAIPVHELEEPGITEMECVPGADEIESVLKKRANRRN